MSETMTQRLNKALAGLPAQHAYTVIEFAEFLSHRRHAASSPTEEPMSDAEHKRILYALNGVTAFSAESGPPVSNREHDQILYRGT